MMALLRPCGRFRQPFGKLAVFCQAEHIREILRVKEKQGYVTVTPKAGNSRTKSEKLQVPSSNNLNQSEVTPENLTRMNLQQRLTSLCLGTKNGRIRSKDLVKILESYNGTVGNDSMENQDSSGLVLLRNCGNTLSWVSSTDRRILTSRVWEIIRHGSCTLTLEHYNTLLRIHVENNQMVEPKIFLDGMTVDPNDKTYILLLNAAARCGDVQSAMYILSRMKSEGFSLNERVFNLLILAHAKNKDIKAVLSMLDTMIDAKIEPGVETYGNIAYGYASVGDIDHTLKILNAHSPNVSHIMEIIKRLSDLNLGKHIGDVLKYLQSTEDPTEMIFSNTLTHLIYNGKLEDAFELISHVTPSVAIDSDETHPVFDSFLKDAIRAKIPNSTILKFMNRIITEKNYPLAIMDVCEGALRSGDRDLALATFEAMHEKKIQVRPHYYWPLLILASRDHGETDVFRTLRHMLGLNVPLKHDTLLNYVFPYTDTVDPFVTLRKFGDLGLEISVIFTPMICYFLHKGKINEALALCSRIKGPIDFEKVFHSLIVAYKITKNVNDTVKMFKFAPSEKCYPEAFLMIVFGKSPTGQNAQIVDEFLRAFETAEIAVSDFTRLENSKDDEARSGEFTMVNPLDCTSPLDRIPHPRDMNLEELECHLIELRAKGMNTRGVLRKLLLIHCRENNVDRVEAIKEEYREKGMSWTPGMYSSLLEFYAHNGRVDEAMNMYSLIRHLRNYKLDDLKIIHLANALVNANRISEAFAILESTTSSGAGNSRISKDCWRLLDAIARSSNNELTERMLEILVNAGFCDRSNSILGPLVRQHLSRNDLTSAVDTFVKCGKLYRHTPLRQELVIAILESMHTTDTTKETKNETMKLLERVQTMTTMIRGSVHTKMDLLVGLARLRMTDQLRKFLQNNQVADDTLKRNLALVSEDHKLSVLTTILDASSGMPHINRISIYGEILSVHSRSGDCEQVIELWKRLSTEETVVPRVFRVRLESLLRKHNVPLPEGFSENEVR